MRYGLLPVTRRVWSLRGVRPACPVHPRYEWACLYGAAEVGGAARVEFCCCPSVDLEFSGLFLQQVGAREPGATHVVIWDGAGFHPQDGAEGLPDNVRLLPLPSYSPELNPIEGLWDQLKDHLCNKVFASLRAVEKAITNFLRPSYEAAFVKPRMCFSDFFGVALGLRGAAAARDERTAAKRKPSLPPGAERSGLKRETE